MERMMFVLAAIPESEMREFFAGTNASHISCLLEP